MKRSKLIAISVASLLICAITILIANWLYLRESEKLQQQFFALVK